MCFFKHFNALEINFWNWEKNIDSYFTAEIARKKYKSKNKEYLGHINDNTW